MVCVLSFGLLPCIEENLIAVRSTATNLSQDLGLSIFDRCTSVGVCHVTKLCASTQWEMVYWLVFCCYKTDVGVLSYGWPWFKKHQVSSIAFLFRVLQKVIFIQVGKNPSGV